jgi:putative ABC transport system ATP-binding protein
MMIECHGVEKHYRAPFQEELLHWRLEELSIARGERVLVTGPSGCGKTTLLNLLAGLLPPDAGSIEVNGTRVDELSTSDADVFRGANLGLVFQSFHLLPSLTVLENILLGARFGRKWSGHEAHVKAEKLLRQVGLTARQHYHSHHLSIGEQQRVAIARALINEPPLLLADEPTASLDTRNTSTVLDLLFQLCDAQGTTLLVVSHDTSIASRFQRQIDAAPWMRKQTAEVSYV